MRYTLQFEIHGALLNSDEAVYEAQLVGLTTRAVMSVMGWQVEEEALGSYLLSSEQATTIGRLVGISLPSNLDLYLSCRGYWTGIESLRPEARR